MVEDPAVSSCLVPDQNIGELLAQSRSAAAEQALATSGLPAARDVDDDEDELALLTEGGGRPDALRPLAIQVLQEHIETLQKRYSISFICFVLY